MLLTCVLMVCSLGIAELSTAEHPWALKADQLQGCYDFIIVGGGSAGCRLAEKLSSHTDLEILLVEAGKSPPDYTAIPLLTKLSFESSDIVRWYRVDSGRRESKSNAGQIKGIDAPSWSQSVPVGRVLGGGSTVNLMNYERGDHKDYDRWESEFGATGWNGKSMFEYFIKDENNSDYSLSGKQHGRAGDLKVSSSYDTNILKAFFGAAQERGYPVRDTGNGSTDGANFDAAVGNSNCGSERMASASPGVYRMQATIDENGRRSSSYAAFIEKHWGRRKNLHIATKTSVTRILFARGENNETIAKGVELLQDGRPRRVCTRREVILSAGAIETPHLLMLSGIGPRKHLEEMEIKVLADLPVGKNLQNHPVVKGIEAVIDSTSTYEIPSTNDIRGLAEWYRFGRGPFTSPFGTHLGIGFFKINKSSSVPDIEIMLQGLSDEVSCDPQKTTRSNATFSLLTFMMHPKSRGTIELQSKDSFSPPSIRHSLFDNEADVELLARGAKFAYDLIGSKAFEAIGVRQKASVVKECSEKQFNTLEYWKCAVKFTTSSGAHPVGSCRMGDASREDTVVDPELRVKFVKNLRIADCSIMPTLNTGHTNAPAIAIGARAGDLILREYNYAF